LIDETKRVQLTTDGHKVYLEAVENAFGGEIDYAMLIKVYELTQEETRYSPAKCTGSDIRTCLANAITLNINGSWYVIALNGFADADFEEINTSKH
jgi:hypothetical protein